VHDHARHRWPHRFDAGPARIDRLNRERAADRKAELNGVQMVPAQKA